ncbi:MAG: O-methyltransferase [Clostridia bacterium]|nr:O-methyltransferase [Clostridia bacterium]
MDFDELEEKLSDLKMYAEENFIPIIRDKSAKFLYDFVKDNGFRNVLEIGTAIGYSGSIILSAGAESLTTIEIRKESFEMAKKTFSELSLLDRVDMYLGDAKDVIADLCCANKKYDMIFLDGAKGQYIHYLPSLTKLLDVDGVIFADNVLLQGMVEKEGKIPHRKRTMVVNLRKYLEVVGEYPYNTTLIKMEDGIAITRYKGE